MIGQDHGDRQHAAGGAIGGGFRGAGIGGGGFRAAGIGGGFGGARIGGFRGPIGGGVRTAAIGGFRGPAVAGGFRRAAVAPGVFHGRAFRAFAFGGRPFRRRAFFPVAAGVGFGAAIESAASNNSNTNPLTTAASGDFGIHAGFIGCGLGILTGDN